MKVISTTNAPGAIGPYSQRYVANGMILTCFLADIADFAAFNEVYAKYFTSKPARSCVAVKQIPKGALCEIECIALA